MNRLLYSLIQGLSRGLSETLYYDCSPINRYLTHFPFVGMFVPDVYAKVYAKVYANVYAKVYAESHASNVGL